MIAPDTPAAACERGRRDARRWLDENAEAANPYDGNDALIDLYLAWEGGWWEVVRGAFADALAATAPPGC